MGFVVGSVTDLEKVAGKDKLLKLSVDVGGGSQVTIVTNAPNVNTGSHVVVAMVGTMLSDGTEVKKATVGGCVSEGMLCDPPILGWVGGGSGSAALVPAESFSPGSEPPPERPRMGGPKEEAPAMPAVDVKPLFEKKLTKEEKKAAAAAKKKERDAKKAAVKAGAGEPEDGAVEAAMEDLDLKD